MLCTAVSKVLHLHPASKLASADEVLPTALRAYLYRKVKTKINVNVNANLNLNLSTLTINH